MAMLSGAILMLAAAIIHAAKIQDHSPVPDPFAFALGFLGLLFLIGGAGGALARVRFRDEKDKSPKA